MFALSRTASRMSASMMLKNMSRAMMFSTQDMMIMAGNSFDGIATTTSMNTTMAVEPIMATANNNARTLAALQYLLNPCPEDDRLPMAVAAQMSTKVELVIAAKNLPSKDVLSKSDPMAVLFWWDNQKWMRMDRTEAINNNEDPVFQKRFTVDYFFEMTQKFKVEIYDVDGSNLDNLSSHDNIGHVEFTLGRLMCSPNNRLQIRMTKPTGEMRSKADVIITGYQVVESRHKAYVQVRGVGLDKLSFFGKDSTKLQLLKINADQSQHIVYETEVVKDSQDPVYKPFKVCIGALTGGDVNQRFIARVVRVKGKDTELVGEAQATPNELYRPSSTMADPLKPVQLMRKGKGRGHLHFQMFNIVQENTFLDYVSAGLDFKLICAVDFTGSNGDPRDRGSLHFLHRARPDLPATNQYLDAIRSIGGILTDYARKDLIPVYGFGGWVSVDGRPPAVSHCFPLTRVSANPYVQGIAGFEQVYEQALRDVSLSGPTNFRDLIDMAVATAMEPYRPDYQHYTILLILTDGAICDLQETISAIIAGSDKPLSIIIVGVGSGDFTTMDVLDADERRLANHTGTARRDMVQFVPFLSAARNGVAELAKQTLHEVPTQVLEFMNMHGIKPLPKAE